MKQYIRNTINIEKVEQLKNIICQIFPSVLFRSNNVMNSIHSGFCSCILRQDDTTIANIFNQHSIIVCFIQRICLDAAGNVCMHVPIITRAVYPNVIFSSLMYGTTNTHLSPTVISCASISTLGTSFNTLKVFEFSLVYVVGWICIVSVELSETKFPNI